MIKSISTILSVFILLTTVYSQKDTWHCINEKGEIMFSTNASRVSDFSNGLALIKIKEVVNNKWTSSYGYINTTGQIQIPCKYEKANDFNADVTWVKEKGATSYLLINKKGEIILTKKYTKVGSFYKGYEDMCAVFEDGKMGFINTQGKEVIPCKYSGSRTFHEGLACVTLYDDEIGKYGFINKKGEVVIPFQYKQAGTSSFTNGECRVSVNGKIVLINHKGEVIFKTQYKSLQDFNFGLGAVCTKSDRTGWGFIDKNDNWIVKPIYEYVSPFNDEGYAIIENNKLQGAIDTTGKIVIPMKYETLYIEPNKDGRFCGILPSETPVSMYDAEKDYFDNEFNKIELTNVLFLSGANGSKLMKYTDSDKNMGFMNRDFEIVIPAKYKKARDFNEGLTWVKM